MAQYIDKDALVYKIEDKINMYTKCSEKSDDMLDGCGIYWGCVLSCLNKVKTLINTIEVKEVDFETLSVLAKHLIACDAHGITPKYSDRELDFLEGLTE